MTPYCKLALGSSQVHSYTIWSSLLFKINHIFQINNAFSKKKSTIIIHNHPHFQLTQINLNTNTSDLYHHPQSTCKN